MLTSLLMFDNIDETVFFKTAKAPPHHIGNLKKKERVVTWCVCHGAECLSFT